MSLYTPPALNAVDFAITTHTPENVSSPQNVLTSYSVPALSAVAFALVAYTAPTYQDVGWELLPGAPSFPTQYAGLRYYHGTVKELCLVATADAPTGNQWLIRKGATTYAVYLVDTSDPNASAVRVKTAAGIKAARLKT
jgi:hypothetical protein